MYLTIHADALGRIAGAFLIFVFTLYSFIYIRMRHSLTLALDFILVQLTLFLLLAGYSFYVSLTRPGGVLLWTKICYAGASLTPGATYRLYESLQEKKHGKMCHLYSLFSLLLTGVLFLPGDFLFTAVLNTQKSHSSVIKGPLFPYYVGVLILLLGYVMVRTVFFIMKNQKRQTRLKPIIYGLAVFFLSASFDALFAAVFSLVKSQLWIGPTALALSLALYNARVTREYQEELEDLREERERIYHNLIHDKLTGLYTRNYLYESICQINSQVKRSGYECSLIFIDVDNFKLLNDEMGHVAGDQLLEAVGKALLEKTRNYDIPARLGGDEFILFLPDSSSAGAEKAARHIQTLFLSLVDETLSEWEHRDRLTLSIGIVSRDAWVNSPQELITRADRAMYQSKSAGKNRITHFEGATA